MTITRNIAMITKTLPKTTAKKTATTSRRADKPTNGVHSDEGVKGSFYEKNKHLIGSLSSNVTDLSSNKAYLKGFGRNKNADNL
jgi:hypothetical protein